MPLSREELIRELTRLHESRDTDGVAALLETQHPADTADALEELEPEAAKFALSVLSHEDAADVLRETEEEARSELIEGIEDHVLSDIVEEMEPDDAADFLEEMEEVDEKKAERVLQGMEEEERTSVQTLLNFEEDTAGGIMQPDFVAFPAHRKAGDIIDELRRRAIDEKHLDILELEDYPLVLEDDAISYVYVVDEVGRLLGTVSLYALISAPPATPVQKLAQGVPATVRVHTDQEEVARIVEKYDLMAVPVLDDHDVLVGRITLDDIIDVIEEEADEDIMKMAGTSNYELDFASPFRGLRARIPWLFVALACSLVSASVLAGWDESLQHIPGLIFFVPVIMAMGGNTSLQSSTLVIRGIATGRIVWQNLLWLLSREILVGSLLGLLCGLVAGLAGPLLLGQASQLGVIITSSMLISLTVSALVGTAIPMFLNRIGIDPAVATGPFITTLNDIIGLLVYFTVATFLSPHLPSVSQVAKLFH